MKFKSKQEIQDYAVQLSNNHDYILLEHCTGLGKSLSAIRIIEHLGGYWHIIIAETNHELNWRNEFIKHNKGHLLSQVEFTCYASLHKHTTHKNYILDEIHHALQSDIRMDLLKRIKNANLQKLVGLSATLTWRQKEILEEIIGDFHNFKVTISQAVSWGLLPRPKVFLIPTTLDDTIKNQTYKFGVAKVKVTELHKYNLLTDKIDFFKKKFFDTRHPSDEIRWLSMGSQRKRFMAECKTKIAKVIIDKLKDKRFICFTGTIKQSEELSNGLSVHSKITKKEREELLVKFNNKEINYLFSTNMLREGMNLDGIEAGIIVQLDNQQKNFIQQLGRTVRSDSPELYIIYIENTQDETYVRTALEGFDTNYLAEINVEDL